jgi:hypothetical protein
MLVDDILVMFHEYHGLQRRANTLALDAEHPSGMPTAAS